MLTTGRLIIKIVTQCFSFILLHPYMICFFAAMFRTELDIRRKVGLPRIPHTGYRSTGQHKKHRVNTTFP